MRVPLATARNGTTEHGAPSTEKNDDGDDTPHELPADPTAGAPVGDPCAGQRDTCVWVQDSSPGDSLSSDDLSLGGGPASVNGGRAGGRGRKQSFASCVAAGGKIFSLQGMLQFASGGHLGNGFLSDAFLGNTVSTGIEIAQAAQSGSVSGIAGAAAPEVAGRLAGPAATLGANAMPNVAVGISVTQVAATSTSLTVEGFSAALSLKGLAKAGASALNVGLETIEAPKAIVDATGAVFGVAICGMMR